MKLNKLLFLPVCLVFLFLWSCESEDPVPAGKYSNGIFILNEGAFGNSNASVSFYSPSGDTVDNDIFSIANAARPLGDVLQSALRHNGSVYLVMNASNKVEVVQETDFVSEGVIEGVSGPRYMMAIDDKGYLTQWGNNGQLKIIDLNTMDVTQSVDVGSGPENILDMGEELWIANSGGFGKDSIVSVFDVASESVTQEIELSDNPVDMVVDADGDVWVLCAGHTEYDQSFNVVGESASRLYELDADNYSIKNDIKLFDQKHPNSIEISPDRMTLYVGGGFGFVGIYAMDITESGLDASPWVDATSFYGFSVNPDNGDIYAMEAPSFTDNGYMYVYNAQGTEIAKHEVGIGPNGAMF